MTGRIRVRTGLDRAPVVTGRQCHCIDAVHNALVMRCRPVGVYLGKIGRDDDAVTYLFTTIFLHPQLLGR